MIKYFTFLLLYFTFFSNGLAQSMGAWEQVYDNNPDEGVGVVDYFDVHPTDSNFIYILASGCVWKSTNRGDSWSLHSEYDPDFSFERIKFDPVNGNIVWAQINNKLYKSLDGGNSWTFMNQTLNWVEQPILIDPNNGNNITVYNDSGIYKSTDGGVTWVHISTIVAFRIVMNPLNPNTLYAAPNPKKSIDGGATWTSLNAPATAGGYQYSEIAMTPADTNYVYFYGCSGAGYNSQIAYSVDGGSTFTLQPMLTNVFDKNFFRNMEVSKTNKNDLCVAGVGFFRSTNSGNSFVAGGSLHVDHRHLGFDKFNTLWSANDGGIYMSKNMGATWINKTSNLNIHSVEDMSSNELDSAVFSVGLMHDAHKLKTSTGWKTVFSGDGFNTAVHPTNPQIVYGKSQYSYSKSLNGGLTTTGAFTGITESMYSFVTEFPIAFNGQNPNSVYLLVDNVWKGTVSGTAMVKISNFPYSAGTFLHVCPTDSNIIYTSGFKTVNGGVSWTTNSQYIIAVDPDEPNKVWSLGAFSSDGGTTWIQYPMHEVEPIFIKGEPANNSYNGIYIYSGNYLFYIDDRLSNWQDIRTGLPPYVTFSKLNVLENFNLARVGVNGRGVWESPTYNPDTLVAQIFTVSTPYSSNTGCAGDTIRFYDNSISSGLGLGTTYLWTFPGGIPSSSTNVNQDVVYTTPGAYPYSLTVTNFLGTSTAYDTITISGIVPDLLITSNSPVCQEDTLLLNASTSSGGDYYWTGPSNFTSNLEDPTVANFYSWKAGNYICYLDLNGCLISDTVNVALYVSPSVSVSNTGPYCDGGTAQLNASSVPGASYSWTGPNGFTSSLQNPTVDSLTALKAGSYCLNITTDGCQSSNFCTTVSLTTPPTPVSSANFCSGQTINVPPGGSYTGGTDFLWSGPNGYTSTSASLYISNSNSTMSGIYTVQKDACHILGTVNVTVTTTPTVPIVSNTGPYCSGATVQLYATSIGATSYQWTGSLSSTQQNPSFTGYNSATYQVYGLNGSCASPLGSTSVVMNPTPNQTGISGPTSICSGNTLNLSANNVVGATYTWTGPMAISTTTNSLSLPNVNTSMSGLYTVYITSSLGCSSSIATKNVVVNQTPGSGGPSNTGPYCVGNTLQLNSAYLPGATYQWWGPNSYTSSSQNPSISNATTNMSGTYQLLVSNNGCSGPYASTSVVVNALPTAPIASNTGAYCEGDPIQLNATLVSGATYEWTGPNGFTSNVQNPTIPNSTAAMAGIYQVRVIMNGCASPYNSTTVGINPSPSAPIASNTGAYCEGDLIQLNATLVSGATYEWTGPNGFTSTLQNPSLLNATIGMSGTYEVRALVNGCYSPYNPTMVTVNSTPQIILGDTSIVCIGDTLFLVAISVSSGNYNWTGPSLFVSQQPTPIIPNAQINLSGYYFLGIELNGCQSDTDSTFISIVEDPTVSTLEDTVLCIGSLLMLSATGALTYSWDNGLGVGNNFLVSPATNSTYIVTGLDANNCSNTDTVEVSIASDPNIVFSISNDSICSSSGVFDLIATPAGGAFLGSGVTGSQFDPGTANIGLNTITYKIITSDSCEFESTQQIYVLDCANVQVNEIQKLRIYPNPTSNQLTIISSYTILSVSLIDTKGRLILKKRVNNNAIDLDLKEYSDGIYYIKIEQEFESFNEKIIIQR